MTIALQPLIRLARPDDAARFSALALHYIPQFAVAADGSGLDNFVAHAQANAFEERITNTDFVYFCVEMDAHVVGFIAIVHNRHLQNLYVDEKHHGLGVASALWQAAKSHCTALGSQFFTVNASDQAVPIYEHWGFVATGERDGKSGAWVTPMRLN